MTQGGKITAVRHGAVGVPCRTNNTSSRMDKILSGPEEQSREVVKAEAGRGGNHVLSGHFPSVKVNNTHGGRRLGKLQRSAAWESWELSLGGDFTALSNRLFRECPCWRVQVCQRRPWHGTHLQRAATLLRDFTA